MLFPLWALKGFIGLVCMCFVYLGVSQWSLSSRLAMYVSLFVFWRNLSKNFWKNFGGAPWWHVAVLVQVCGLFRVSCCSRARRHYARDFVGSMCLFFIYFHEKTDFAAAIFPFLGNIFDTALAVWAMRWGSFYIFVMKSIVSAAWAHVCDQRGVIASWARF